MVAEAYRRVHADPRIEVVPFDRDLIHTAIEFYGARPDKHWSLTDCLSFVVMERVAWRKHSRRTVTSSRQI